MTELALRFMPVTLDLASAPLHVGVGTIAGRRVRTTGTPGTLVFGPYCRLPRGTYQLVGYHRPLAPNAPQSHATLHVWSALGRSPIAASPLARDGVTPLQFTLHQDMEDVEFVITVEAEAALEFDRYELAARTPILLAPDDRVLRRDYGSAPAFRHIVSLGTHCYTASLLQRQGWKHFSAPFDWIFSTPAMVRHCIEDDFATLLDRS